MGFIKKKIADSFKIPVNSFIITNKHGAEMEDDAED